MRLAFLALGLACALPCKLARASDSAERLFREARAEMAAGNYASACPKLEESQRIEPAPGTLMNLADCEEHVGRIVAARNDFALAASGFSREDPRRAFVLQHASDLEKRFAHLTLRFEGAPVPNATVRRANVIVASSSFGAPVDVDPGEQAVVVSAPGRIDRRFTVHLGAGESKELVVDVGPAEPTKTIVKTLVYADRANPKRVAGIVVGVIGLLGVGLGAGAGILAIDDASVVRAHCNAAGICDTRGAGAVVEGRVVAPLSTGAFIIGGGFVLAGAMLLWASAGGSRATLAPMVTANGAGLFFDGAF